MSTEKALQLNNEVVVPAKQVREYQSNSLAKNNNIGQVTITNPDFLVSRVEKDAYVFATIDNISGSIDSEWTKTNSGSIVEQFGGTSSGQTATRTLSVSIPQGKRQVRLTGNIFLLVHAGTAKEQSVQIEINKLIFYSGDTKTFSNRFQIMSGMSSSFATLSCSLTFSNNQISAYISGGVGSYYKKWEIVITLSNVEVVTAEGVTGTITGVGGKKYSVGSSYATLTDNGEIFVVPQSEETIRTDRTQYATCSYTKRDATKNEDEDGYLTTVDEAYVSLKPYLYDDYESFINDCRQTIPNESNPSVLYVGLNKQVYKSWNRTLRFDKTFPIYTCVMQAESDTIYNENVSVKLWKRPSSDAIAYTKKEALYESSVRVGNTHAVQANSLWQEGTLYGSENKTLESIIFTDISEKFKNGRNTTKVSVFYDKYLDLDGSTVYNGVDGYFPKVDDIITPYTIRTRSGADLPIEVPLYTENYITNQDGSQSAVGKQFYVTSCSLEYDGDFRIEIEAIEKTD